MANLTIYAIETQFIFTLHRIDRQMIKTSYRQSLIMKCKTTIYQKLYSKTTSKNRVDFLCNNSNM